MLFTAKTVDEAIELGLKELGIDKDEADITVVEEPVKGLFGKMKGNGVVDMVKKEEISLKPKKEEPQVKLNAEQKEKTEKPVKTEKKKKTEIKSSGLEEKFLTDLLKLLNIEATIERTDLEDKEVLTLVSADSSTLIGYRGEMLDAIQTLVCAVANIGNKEYKKVSVDCENYRGRREETLVKLAQKLEEKAVEMRREVELEPMNPYERRIIHTALAESDKVTTKSSGKEPNRFVVIVPNDKDENSKPYNAGAHHGQNDFKGRRNGFSDNKGGRRNGKNNFAEKPKRATPSGFGTYLGNSLKDKD